MLVSDWLYLHTGFAMPHWFYSFPGFLLSVILIIALLMIAVWVISRTNVTEIGDKP